MKKFNLVLVLLISGMISSCYSAKEESNSTNNPQNNSSSSTVSTPIGSIPKFRGNRDFTFDLQEEGYIHVASYDFLGNTKAIDEEDGDITNKITYEITNYYTNEAVSIISLTEDGKFNLRYNVVDSDGNSNFERQYIVVGDPNSNLDENGNKKQFPNITPSEYEKVSSTYSVIFEEDFNYTGAPGTVVGENDYGAYAYQTGGGGWGNQESQIYEKADRTCYVSNGNLKIQAIKENNTIYSARLNTSDNFSRNWLYGKYEVTAKLPNGAGAWPAIWMMPNNFVSWPASGEIDIMETSQYYTNRIIGTVHTTSFNHTINTQKSGGVSNIPTIYSDYHKYGIEWLPDCIKFYYDDTNYFTFRPANYVNKVTNDAWPFDKSFHFIFNIAIGGMMGGSISSSLFDNEVAMYIDKITVSQSSYINETYVK